MPPSRAAPAARLPAYALYGDAVQAALPDRLHAEQIAARSRLHGWEIRPHRHEALAQCLVLAAGGAEVALDGRSLALQGPAVVTVPALTVHGFRFTPEVQGSVFTVPEPHLRSLLAGHAGLADTLLQPRAATGEGAAGSELLAAAAALQAEADAAAPWRAAALDAGLLRLAVAAARVLAAAPVAAGEGAAAPSSRALAHVRRLQALVEARYAEHPSQAALAASLGLTPTQLNRVCRAVLGHPASQVLQARLLLQAQRELAYTRLSVKQVALALGFADAAHFSRFFRRHTGTTPSAWRAGRSGGGAAAGPAGR